MQPNILSASVWGTLFDRSKENPHLIFPGIIALINGHWHKVKFILQGKNIRIGKAFRLHGRLVVRGPGKVEIGDDCLIHSDIFGVTALHTTAKEAIIRIGDHAGLNGSVIHCQKEISIEEQVFIANAYITDFQGHISEPSIYRRPQAAVRINRGVWICAFSVVNMGVDIGEGSVIGALSFVNRNVPANCLYAGAPAGFVKHLGE
jgi:acetyltransferase-like isoleucine patch superfamily enzyme